MQKISVTVLFMTLISVTSWAQKATKEVIQKGKIVFEQNCLVCHQVDGSGVPNLNPPLIKTSFVLGDKKRLITIVLKGLSDVEIDGESYSNPMPSMSFLSDEDIANVLTYVRNSFTNKASAVSAVEVKAGR